MWLDYYVCVHVPGATTTAPGPKPTDDGHSPTQPGIAKNCDKYHKIVSGDQCDAIESQNKITHEQFLKWNPAIDSSMSHLSIFCAAPAPHVTSVDHVKQTARISW